MLAAITRKAVQLTSDWGVEAVLVGAIVAKLALPALGGGHAGHREHTVRVTHSVHAVAVAPRAAVTSRVILVRDYSRLATVRRTEAEARARVLTSLR